MADALHRTNSFADVLKSGIAYEGQKLRLDVLAVQGTGDAIVAEGQGIWNAVTHPISAIQKIVGDSTAQEHALRKRLVPDLRIIEDSHHHTSAQVMGALSDYEEVLSRGNPMLMMGRMGREMLLEDFKRITAGGADEAIIMNAHAPGISPAAVARAEVDYKQNAGPVVLDALSLASSAYGVGVIARGRSLVSAAGVIGKGERTVTVTLGAARAANAIGRSTEGMQFPDSSLTLSDDTKVLHRSALANR